MAAHDVMLDARPHHAKLLLPTASGHTCKSAPERGKKKKLQEHDSCYFPHGKKIIFAN